jgi:type VI secretion system protein ImpD
MATSDSVRKRVIDEQIDEAIAGRLAPEVDPSVHGDDLLGEIVRRWLEETADRLDPTGLVMALNRQVALIDRLITDQVNAILHHESLQRLEAAWRGLAFLLTYQGSESSPSTRLKIFDVSWAELGRDLDRAIDFDQSELFRKVYESEFGSPGGQPFGVLIGDYEIQPRIGTSGSLHDDLDTLKSVANVAAAAFCPFIANASPAMFGVQEFADLQQTLDHTYQMNSWDKWQSLRNHDDARFVGLAMPRILMRRPYRASAQRVDGFVFSEDVGAPHQRHFLWGGAAFAVGAVILRAYENAGWPANIRGVQQGIDAGGLVWGLTVDEPGTDSPGVVHKYTTDVVITDHLEKQLGDLGFIPLCDCHQAPYAAFYSVPSVQKPRTMDRAAANANARLSAMLPYMLCVSRFAHYIKVLGRDRVGTVNSTDELERILQDWLTRYVVLDDNASPATKARNPLREAKIQVLPKPGAPGAYRCVIHLVPHYELDDLAVKVRLTTEINSPRPQ